MIQKLVLLIILVALVSCDNLRVSTPAELSQAVGMVLDDISNVLGQGSFQRPGFAPRPSKDPESYNDVTLTHHMPSTFVVG